MIPSVHYVLWLAGLQEAVTQTTRDERQCLAHHAAGRKRLAEIGVFEGVTTAELLGVVDVEADYIAIDPYYRGRLGVSFQELIARRNVASTKAGRVHWICKTGQEAAEDERVRALAPFDFVFIDGDHSWEGIQSDWSGFSGLVAHEGVVALHDSRNTVAESARFTREVILNDPRYECIDEVGTLTVVKRTSAP